MRFAQIVMAYFLIGALMWAGGVVDWSDSGVGGVLIDDPGVGDADTEVDESTQQDLEGIGGVIQQAVQTGAGGLIAVWNIAIQLIGYLFWPITTLVSLDAPPRAVVIFGGTPTVAFLGAVLRLVKTSA
jgi:hypothetical protein